MTQDVLGQPFGIQQPVANKWIHLLLPVLNWALADLGELPARGKQPWIRSQTPEPVYEHAIGGVKRFRIVKDKLRH